MMKTEMKYRKINEEKQHFVSPGGMVIGGLFMILFGIFLVLLTTTSLVGAIAPKFLMVVSYSGIFMFVQGLLVLLRGIIGNRMVGLHQFMIVLYAFLTLCSISLLVILYYEPSVIPFYIYDESDGALVKIAFPFELSLLQLAIVVIIALTIIDALTDLFKAGKLEKYKL